MFHTSHRNMDHPSVIMQILRMTLDFGIVPVPRNTHMMPQHNMLVQITKKPVSINQPASPANMSSGGGVGGVGAGPASAAEASEASALADAAVPLPAAVPFPPTAVAFAAAEAFAASRRSKCSATWAVSQSELPSCMLYSRSSAGRQTAQQSRERRWCLVGPLCCCT